jgi:hypothetical protein
MWEEAESLLVSVALRTNTTTSSQLLSQASDHRYHNDSLLVVAAIQCDNLNFQHRLPVTRAVLSESECLSATAGVGDWILTETI